MSPRVELVSFVLICAAVLFVLVATVVMASRLTERRIGALEALSKLLAAKATTYIPVLIAIGNEIYSSYTYQQPLNITAILELMGIATVRASLKGDQLQKQIKDVKSDTEVVVNTMPVAAARPPVTPTRVAPAPSPVKDSS